ncbi:MAG TPA: trehalose-6-phosphate synthase, partial [Gaiellaceae bacterium]|nr:trehalose-6-phosphate synthase [Gaiellaceae bacterium]
MPDRRQLIVVSNRGPVTYDRDASGERIAKRGGGGLVTALRGLLDHHDVTWIASAATAEDRVVADEGNEDVVLLAHDPEVYDRYYNVVANPMLWFIQHSLWARALRPNLDRAFHDAWHDYEQVNSTFADAVLAQLDNKPKAAVFFHDYHLYL